MNDVNDERETDRGTLLHTLDRGLQVLEAIAASEGEATAKVLSRQLGIKIGTCYHLLRTLVAAGYVVRLTGGVYDVGPRAASLSRHLQRRSGPSPELSVILTRLHNKTQETVYLSGWQHGTPTLQHYLTGEHALRVGALDVGYVGNMHARASCKAILAYLPEEQVAVMLKGVPLEALTPNTITDFDEFTVELARVRSRGYALDLEEFSPGVVCLSAAFFDGSGLPVGSFTASVPVTRFTERQARLAAQVREAGSMATTLLRTGRIVIPSAG
ncbi:DNA-binding IclR family transcriptional regulator [Nonomuraea muscovyensis]|uniref:DNA-binding IclR family transcriptional regulator n=1 Tax=Nonomuraea muscovyensis TaxID=1124761 RepID=A0A7X0C7M1_9ACTN|nr:IclR family transcriptional regulator [Nonomuraea muscovyensis]MBB6350007.1 DNA-binding IclR family transcriptional regulator [Nonomuraea muscovyensis]